MKQLEFILVLFKLIWISSSQLSPASVPSGPNSFSTSYSIIWLLSLSLFGDSICRMHLWGGERRSPHTCWRVWRVLYPYRVLRTQLVWRVCLSTTSTTPSTILYPPLQHHLDQSHTIHYRFRTIWLWWLSSCLIPDSGSHSHICCCCYCCCILHCCHSVLLSFVFS
jgi:hypothetical protein